MVAGLDSADSGGRMPILASMCSFLPSRWRPVGFGGPMEGQFDFNAFVPQSLAFLGIEADDVDLAVMRAVHDNWWPAVAELLQLDLSGVEPEPRIDVSRAPER